MLLLLLMLNGSIHIGNHLLQRALQVLLPNLGRGADLNGVKICDVSFRFRKHLRISRDRYGGNHGRKDNKTIDRIEREKNNACVRNEKNGAIYTLYTDARCGEIRLVYYVRIMGMAYGLLLGWGVDDRVRVFVVSVRCGRRN